MLAATHAVSVGGDYNGIGVPAVQARVLNHDGRGATVSP